MAKTVTIIGAGPAGLMAAQELAKNGLKVTIFERKKTPARKFLIAGRGGLNLTHSEELSIFVSRYREAQDFLAPLLENFSPLDLQNWCRDLGEETFVGSSGRIFPKTFKASPLLRAFLRRLELLGVEFKMEKDWIGWQDQSLVFQSSDGSLDYIQSDATLLTLGGASWPHLGSDGSWFSRLTGKNIDVSPLKPSNCGFKISWSDLFRNKFSGNALKTIALKFGETLIPGEIMIDENGIEGGAVYAISAQLREAIEERGNVTLHIDLKPGLSEKSILEKMNSRPRQRQSFSTYLEKTIGLSPLAINLMREADMNVPNYSSENLSRIIKSLPLTLTAPFDIDKAISSAGGVSLHEIDENMMLRKLNGVFSAGEMLDWEAPTGGYLLQASFSTGVAAAKGILEYLNQRDV